MNERYNGTTATIHIRFEQHLHLHEKRNTTRNATRQTLMVVHRGLRVIPPTRIDVPTISIRHKQFLSRLQRMSCCESSPNVITKGTRTRIFAPVQRRHHPCGVHLHVDNTRVKVGQRQTQDFTGLIRKDFKLPLVRLGVPDIVRSSPTISGEKTGNDNSCHDRSLHKDETHCDKRVP